MSRSVFAAITGRPNAGKSSLLNALVGEKIAMVTDRPQTTRTKITGVLTEGDLQYVFIDTPGIHKAHNRLGHYMNKAVRQAVTDIDAAVYMADVTRKMSDIDHDWIKGYMEQEIPVILVLNKCDLVEDKGNIAMRIAEYSDLGDYAAVIPVSVKRNDGVDLVKAEIEKFASESVHYFPDDKLTDQPEKVIMAEMIREKLMKLTYEEIPHGLAVVIDGLTEGVTKSGEDIMHVSAVIYCERESHKGMVIGKNGAVLKKAGSLAREELENFFGIKTDLKLWVKVREDWRNNEGLIKNFGLSDV
ncbi:MAG: GTPase Era [Oscillospiraceae bacterium]|nr:GTPase Era [Oscillospiraceae bacterium]